MNPLGFIVRHVEFLLPEKVTVVELRYLKGEQDTQDANTSLRVLVGLPMFEIAFVLSYEAPVHDTIDDVCQDFHYAGET